MERPLLEHQIDNIAECFPTGHGIKGIEMARHVPEIPQLLDKVRELLQLHEDWLQSEECGKVTFAE
jgi:hypothetical protein